jgi:hypothetical protein
MPVPQENSLFVEQASYLFLRMVQDVRQDGCSTRKFTLCGTGILPVLENGARCEVSELQTDNFEILFKQ